LRYAKKNNFIQITNDGGINESSVDSTSISKLLDGHVVSVIVRDGSQLLDKTPKEVNFRKTYDASIISIQRAGKDISDKPIGQTQLKIGDVLVLLTGSNFSLLNDSPDLKILVSASKSSPRSGIKSNFETNLNHYLVGAFVVSKPKLQLTTSLHGKTIEQAGLRGLVGVSLVGITKSNDTSFQNLERNNNSIILRAPGPSERLQNGDICWFTGGRDAVQTIRKIPGLELIAESKSDKLKEDQNKNA